SRLSGLSDPSPQQDYDPMASPGPVSTSSPVQGAGLGESPSMSTEKLSSSAVNRMLMEFLIYCGRAVFVFYPVYLTGYLGLSISWVLLCMFMLTWWKKNRQWKDARIGSAIDFVDNEKHTINTELKGSLQMVNFTDVEKVQWLNKVLEQAWPFFGMYMEKLLRENIQKSVRACNTALKAFTFTKIHFGNIPLKITGIRAYTHEVEHREVILDMNLSYVGDVDIDAQVNPAITAGVKGLKLHGMMRVILEPLIGQAPLVGGVTFFFIRRPTLEINWTGMTNVLDSPAFGSLSEETIIDIIASLMVLPNRMCIPLIDQVKMDQMRFPLPRGVVRVHLLEARDLVAKDTYMMGLVKGKSDPYATLRVGNRNFKSKTIKENLHPKWNEVYEFVVHEAPGQELELELYDEDTDKDDFLGRYLAYFCYFVLPMMSLWFALEDIQHGEVHLKLQWFSLQTDTSLMKEVQQPSVSSDSLTSVVYASKDPVWEEGFTFFVRNVKAQHLSIQVKEPEKKNPLGVLNLPLSRLLNTSDLTLDQRFLLERSGATSQIKLKATLRVGMHTHTQSNCCIFERIEIKVTFAYVFLFRAIRNHQGSFGEIELIIRYATLRHKLVVFVNSCRNLFPCSENGTDSYVRLYLLPDQTWKHRKKTHVKKRTTNPVFNEKVEFDVLLEQAQTRKLDVSVKNNKMLVSRERKDIGSVGNDAYRSDELLIWK
uniref:Extended synaptotagmin-like protein 3 n=1 Tax=Oreochromis niloticus TaxID=8128 RepID=A0A669B1E3_ORENI